jgi:hypothetical protein
VTTTEPHPINAAGDPVNLDRSAAMNVDDAMGISETMEGVDIGNTEDLQDHRGDKETPAPDWLTRRMLVYLRRGVSDSMEWQNLVLALLRFENLNPPSGVGAHLHVNFLLIL